MNRVMKIKLLLKNQNQHFNSLNSGSLLKNVKVYSTSIDVVTNQPLCHRLCYAV